VETVLLNVFAFRNRLQLNSQQALYLLVSNRNLASLSRPLAQVYRDFRDEDGFLYVTYASQEVFGWNLENMKIQEEYQYARGLFKMHDLMTLWFDVPYCIFIIGYATVRHASNVIITRHFSTYIQITTMITCLLKSGIEESYT
jgi:hypothetical protein